MVNKRTAGGEAPGMPDGKISGIPQEDPVSTVKTIGDAFVRIEAMRGQMVVGGNVDQEMSVLDGILEQVRSRALSPEEGVRQAQNLIDSRNDR